MKHTYEVKVTASDGTESSDPITVTITVTDVNDLPMFATESTTLSIPEDTGTGENIGMPVVAMDEDGDTLTYARAGTDLALFTIQPHVGQLYSMADLAEQLDYEGAKPFYQITVTANDGMDDLRANHSHYRRHGRERGTGVR